MCVAGEEKGWARTRTPACVLCLPPARRGSCVCLWVRCRAQDPGCLPLRAGLHKAGSSLHSFWQQNVC